MNVMIHFIDKMASGVLASFKLKKSSAAFWVTMNTSAAEGVLGEMRAKVKKKRGNKNCVIKMLHLRIAFSCVLKVLEF